MTETFDTAWKLMKSKFIMADPPYGLCKKCGMAFHEHDYNNPNMCWEGKDSVKKSDEKGDNAPTNPGLWSQAKSKARSKFKVYPSAYANGWASKWYKSKGGGWKKKGKQGKKK